MPHNSTQDALGLVNPKPQTPKTLFIKTKPPLPFWSMYPNSIYFDLEVLLT